MSSVKDAQCYFAHKAYRAPDCKVEQIEDEEDDVDDQHEEVQAAGEADAPHSEAVPVGAEHAADD